VKMEVLQKVRLYSALCIVFITIVIIVITVIIVATIVTNIFVMT
jgi:hypothetical protein